MRKPLFTVANVRVVRNGNRHPQAAAWYWGLLAGHGDSCALKHGHRARRDLVHDLVVGGVLEQRRLQPDEPVIAREPSVVVDCQCEVCVGSARRQRQAVLAVDGLVE